MDNHTPLLDKKLINDLKTQFSKRIVEVLRDRKVPFSELQKMSSSVIDALSTVSTKEEFVDFLEEAAVVYPYLTNEVKILMSEVKTDKEKLVMDKLSSYIKNFPHQ